MPTYTYLCVSCDAAFEEMRSIAERDNMPECTHCDTNAHVTRPMEAPVVMFNAMVDGQRLKSDSSFKSILDVSKLEVKKANLAPDKRTEIQKEINSLRDHKK